jgi:ABC-type Na+ transport system ATPase subunit NatA
MTLLFFQYIVQICDKIISLKRGEIVKKTKRFELKDIDMDEADSNPEES